MSKAPKKRYNKKCQLKWKNIETEFYEISIVPKGKTWKDYGKIIF